MKCPSPGKIPFLTMRSAAEQMIRAHERHGVWQRPYQCQPGCRKWHLTTKDLLGLPVTQEQASKLLQAVGL